MSNREQLINNLFENMNALKRGMHNQLTDVFRDLPISRTQLELLFTIQHSQPVSAKQLAKHLHLTPGAISQLIDSLVDNAYITRQADQRDRRVQMLQITTVGEAILQDVERLRRVAMEQVMHSLTTEELEVWLRIQQKLTDQFDTLPTRKDTK